MVTNTFQSCSLLALGIVSIIISHDFLKKRKRRRNLPSELYSTPYNAELKLCIELALNAGNEMKKAIDLSKDVYKKGDIDFVTATDKGNEKMIFDSLKRSFPHYSFIGEESSADSGTLPELTNNPTWIVDPVDGTTNFVHSFPFSCVSIALVVNQQSVLGVVYNPSMDELFLAVKGYGSYVNGKRMKVTDATGVNESLMLAEFGYGREQEDITLILNCINAFLTHGVHAVRMMGSGVLDLCFVASGRLDFVYTGVAGEGWKPWDYAAAGLMVIEAGGVMSDLNGKPFHIYDQSMLASSSMQLHQEALNIIQRTIITTSTTASL